MVIHGRIVNDELRCSPLDSFKASDIRMMTETTLCNNVKVKLILKSYVKTNGSKVYRIIILYNSNTVSSMI